MVRVWTARINSVLLPQAQDRVLIRVLPSLRCQSMKITPNHRLPPAFWHSGKLLRVLALVGTIAVLSSAISPIDDDVQQEFLTNCKKCQVAAAKFRTVRARLHQSSTSHAILIPLKSAAALFAVEAKRASGPAILMAGLAAFVFGLRSPPCHSST